MNPKVYYTKPKDGKPSCPKVAEIDQTLLLKPATYEQDKLQPDPDFESFKMSELYDCCIFMGGFNTPIIGSAKGVNSLIQSNMFESLKKNDKMYIDFRESVMASMPQDSSDLKKFDFDESRKFEQSSVLSPYHEGEVMFAPTYKIVPFTDSYDTSDCTQSGDSY